MRLFHSTDKRIIHPDCQVGRDDLDFGKGFYTTLLREHAEGWARQVAFLKQELVDKHLTFVESIEI